MDGLSLLVSLPKAPESLTTLEQELSWDTAASELAAKLFDRGLPPLVDRKCLPYLFGVSPRLISAMEKHPERYYRIFQLRKRAGGERQIEAPRRFGKLVQRWINYYILPRDFPSYVTGFVERRNIFDNANVHVPGKNLMVIDIEEFFPSIKINKISAVFDGLGFPTPASLQLASLCSFQARLPQGAPTSPAIANVVFQEADAELNSLAASWRCTYSRYADDLAFSGARRFSDDDARAVESVLVGHGFAINRSKSRRVGGGARQVVTGLVVNRRAQPPRWKRRMWRAMFHRASLHSEEFKGRDNELAGVAAFINQYDRELAARYREIAAIVRNGRSWESERAHFRVAAEDGPNT